MGSLTKKVLQSCGSTQMGREALEGLRFLASLPLASTRQREGGRFSRINKRIISHPVKYFLQPYLLNPSQNHGCLSHQVVFDPRLEDVDDEAGLRQLPARRKVPGVLARQRVLEVGSDLGRKGGEMRKFSQF